MKQKFPGRFTLTLGDSTETVPLFFREHPNLKCDIISVDGGHSYEVSYADIFNFRAAATECSVVFIDDTNCNQNYCVDKSMDELIDAGYLTDIRRVNEGPARGLTLLQYNMEMNN
jgi:hypothetical protein